MRHLLLLALLVGCNKLSADECKREAVALQALLRSVDTGGSMFYVDDAMKLVERSDLPDAEVTAAPVIILGERDTTYQGHLIARPDELRARLEAAHAKITDDLESGRVPRRYVSDPALVYLQIDARVRWSRVVETWQAARDAKMTSTAFVFAGTRTIKPPPRAPVDAELDAIQKADDNNKATKLADVITKQVQGCPAVIRAFGRVGAEESGSKSKMLIDDLAPALVECKCNLDMPNFRSTMWRFLANPHPTRVLRFDPAAPAQPIVLAATATWADAAARLPADLKNAALAVQE